MKHIFTFSAYLFLSIIANAQNVTGIATDADGVPLSFCSILVRGTTIGASGNSQGFFALTLSKGKYTLVCQHVGYKTVEQDIVVGAEPLKVGFSLPTQQYNLKDVVISTNGEDPAYAIIRKAIKKRKDYQNELTSFQCNVYIKGHMRIRDFPKKFLGVKVDFEDGDTSKKKMIFLSETIAKYTHQEPDNNKIEVLSTKVSGNSNGYGFSNPNIISFYDNNIQIGENLNPRGFISPISNNALNYYKYKFKGTFYENGKEISRIEVIPRRDYEPLFNGFINIIENEWRLFSVDLQLYKRNQIQLLDTLRIEQTFIPVNNVWVVKQQVVYPAAKVFGFDVVGNFVQVYDNFNLSPQLPKNYFNSTVLKYFDSSNKKSNSYWDSIRPIPLQYDEIADYKKKDSLEIVRKSKKYLDSLDRNRNKLNPMGVLLTGSSFSQEKNKIRVEVPAIFDMVTFNPAEGLTLRLAPDIYKRFGNSGRQSLHLTPHLQYGFSNRHFNAHATGSYTYGKKYLSVLTVSGGKRVFQYNNDQPITPRDNSFTSLLWENNYMKTYEAWVGKVALFKGIGDGLSVYGDIEWQKRNALENTTNYSWRNIENRVYTPNYPTEIMSQNLQNHSALSITAGVQWQPKAKYVEFPNRKVNIGSRWPTFNASITQGVNAVLGSNVDYTKWKLSVNDNLNLKIGGKLNYRANISGFLNNKSVFAPDYTHYLGNELLYSQAFLESYQIAGFYQFSNTNRFNAALHVEYHLNGLITNKIPVFRKLNWFWVVGSNMLNYDKQKNYAEVFFGVENILKIIRVDYVHSFLTGGLQDHSIRISLSGVVKGKTDR